MTKEEAIKYLQQLYPQGGHCWLDEQRIEAIGMAVKALQEEPVSEDLELEEEITKCYKSRIDLMMTRKQFGEIIHHFTEWQKEQMMAELQAKDSMPVSDELEKVAELYTLDDKIKPWRNLTKEAFIAGAKWKKEQMMAKAINTEASLTLSVPSICISLPHGVNVGDKVKVIVIKED